MEDVGNCILRDRTATHGDPENSFAAIADYWNTFLWQRFKMMTLDITPSDVAIMMALLKVARASGNPYHMDNYIDGAGYLLLAGEQNAK